MAVTMWGSSALYENGLFWFKNNADTILISNTKPTSTWLWADFKDSSSSTGLWVSGTTQMASSDWTIGAGTISGYKVTMGVSSNVQNMTVTGPTTKAAAICVGCGTSSKLMYITSMSTLALSTAVTADIPAWRVELTAPSSS